MKRLLPIIALDLLCMTSAHAMPGDQTNPFYMRPGFIIPRGFCQITVTTATTFAVAGCTVPPGSTYALVCNESTAARYRDDGVAPTASVGQILGTGTATAPICAAFQTTLASVQFITTSGSSLLDVSFYQ
jgi:hypothetical protein